jgi:riboflavin biosynthesis pyrimidine reductase
LAEQPLVPFEDLYDATTGDTLPLPRELADLYGALRLPSLPDRPYLTSNFVSSLDGVVALGDPGTGGDEISGGSREDRLVMGLLRSVADIIIVGAGTLRAWPRHLWTPEAIYKPMADAFRRLRQATGRTTPALTVVVTARGDLDLTLPVFTEGPAMIVTTEAGARRLGAAPPLRTVSAGVGASLHAGEILRAVAPPAGSHVLLECGPTLMGRFVADRAVDELFLTLAPQLAGRGPESHRKALVADAELLPKDPRWSRLLSVKRCDSLLFLRYGFEASGIAG